MSQDAPDEDVALPVAKVLATRWAWLGRALLGELTVGDVRLTGFSVRFNVGDCLVVVRGLDLNGVNYIVAFGRGPRLYDALRNVTTSIRKLQWKKDKYRLEL